MSENKKLTFTTVGGLVLEYEPVSPLAVEYSERGTRKKYKEAGEPVAPPTYETELAGGGTQTFEHDEKSVVGIPEAEALWTKHVEALQRLNAEITDNRNQMLLASVHVELPEDVAWMRRQKRRNIELPEKPDDETDLDLMDEYQEKLRIHYLTTELLKTVEDLYGMVDRIMTASLRGAVSEEQIEAASASFRNTQRNAKRELAESGGNNGQEKQDTVETQS
jgi:uncharacterized membrane-anchored protein YhcB (DUF1043 family)